MADLGKALVAVGLMLALTGLVLWGGGKLPWLGHLPGDIRIEREHYSFYFPVMTCLVISAVLTLLFWLLRRGGRM